MNVPFRIRGLLILLAGMLPFASTSRAQEPSGVPWVAEIFINERIYDGAMRIRVFYQDGYLAVPESVGRLTLVCADLGTGRHAYFIPTDLAFEVGSRQLYTAEFETVADLLGQALGGRLREGESQTGMILLPPPLRVDTFYPDQPESVTVRYANHRGRFRVATPEETAEWETLAPRALVASGLNAWWEWIEAIDAAPAMEVGEERLFSERLFPGQGHIITNEGLSAEALRNAIFRVGDRALLEGPVSQRVAPLYPSVARQVHAEGLVVTLCYVAQHGGVEDATVLASNATHLLNLSALVAAMDWRFKQVPGEGGGLRDGWRLIPFHFQLQEGPQGEVPTVTADAVDSDAPDTPPRILKYVEAPYPVEARKDKADGTVVYEVLLDPRGKMIGSRLAKPVHPLLDEAALTALEQMFFAPATRDGHPVQGRLQVEFPFEWKRR